jgi:hypothetical protein
METDRKGAGNRVLRARRAEREWRKAGWVILFDTISLMFEETH